VAKIFHADLHGLSGIKDKALLTLDIAQTNWSSVDIEASSFYFFIPQNSCLRKEYDPGYKVTHVFRENSLGCLTKRDNLVIGQTIEEVEDKIRQFVEPTKNSLQAVQQFGLKLSDNDMWNAEIARSSIQLSEIRKYIKKESFRPFDDRFIFYHNKFIARLNRRVMRHLDEKNLALVMVRQLACLPFHHTWITDKLSDQHLASVRTKEGGVVLPLYLYPETEAERKMGILRRPNFSEDFLEDINTRLGYTPTPEAIFHYIYAILHSPNYRTRYAEFLKSDFPRVPFTHNDNLFRQLAEYGEQLIALHLMKSPALAETSSPFIENGGGGIVDAGHPKYENGKVIINKKQDCFVDVPKEVWNFYVGGYQVCQKWLKDRKGRTLSADDISHYQKIVVALGQTIELMTKIDEAIPNWPIQ
jgi:predicted helicase